MQNLKDQMTALQSQLTSGNKSTTYAGMGVNEGFAIAARSQLSNISAFTDTMTNINTDIGVANTALQSMVDIGNTVQNSANSSSQTLNSSGQTIAQQTATSQLSSMLGILNTQAGDRYLFSGSAINTPSVASIDDILNGTTTQAGLKQVISERAAGRSRRQRPRASRHYVADRDLGAGGRGCRRLAVRPEAERGLLDADRRDRHRTRGIAGGDFGRPRRHQSRTTATRSALTSICLTVPRKRFS